VPMSFVKNGEIVLNVSATATRKLTIDNAWVQFTARFNGTSQEVSVPMRAVTGIFAKETGYGFAFTAAADPATALAEATAPRESDVAALQTDVDDKDAKPRGKAKRPSHLSIIK